MDFELPWRLQLSLRKHITAYRSTYTVCLYTRT